MYRGDKVFEEARIMTSAEYVAASSAIAQVQSKYNQLSLIAQKDTIYKNYAWRKGHKRKSAVLSSDTEGEVDLEELLETTVTTSILHTMQIRKCQVTLTPLESALEDALKKFKAASPTSELSDTEPAEELGKSDKESADNKDQMQLRDKEEKNVEDSDKNKEQSEDNQKRDVQDSDKNKEQSEDNQKQDVQDSDKNKEQSEDNQKRDVQDSDKNKEQSEDNQKRDVQDSDKNKEQSEDNKDNKEKQDS